MSKQPTWKDLYNFIQEEIKKDPNFLDNKLMIECVDPKSCEPAAGYDKKKDSDGWEYVSPSWEPESDNCPVSFYTTKFSKEKIITLNINY